LEVNPNGRSKEQKNQNHPSNGQGHQEESQGHRQNDHQGNNSCIEHNLRITAKDCKKFKKSPTTTQPSEVDKALAELKMKMAAVEKKEKHKAAVVSKLFAGMKTPFTKQVVEYPIPNKFKSPQISSYSRVGNPTEHLENYLMHLALHTMPNEIVCRAFPTTLKKC
jgi:ribosome maturation protein Sdo1